MVSNVMSGLFCFIVLNFKHWKGPLLKDWRHWNYSFIVSKSFINWTMNRLMKWHLRQQTTRELWRSYILLNAEKFLHQTIHYVVKNMNFNILTNKILILEIHYSHINICYWFLKSLLIFRQQTSQKAQNIWF